MSNKDNAKISIPTTINETYTNVETNAIVITEDKLEICLRDYEEDTKYKVKSLLTPLSIFISILIPLFTASFNKSVFGIEPDVIEAIFYLALVGCIFWMLKILYFVFFKTKKYKDFHSLIDYIKRGR